MAADGDLSSEERSDHYIRANRQQTAWKAQETCLRDRLIGSLPMNVARAQGHAETKRKGMQSEVDESWGAHQCSCSSDRDYRDPLHHSQFSKELDGEVTYVGLECTFLLSMPKWACSCCGQSFTPHALDFGCFPSTPTTPHVWYDLQVLWMYQNSGLLEGLSATGGGAVWGGPVAHVNPSSLISP